jgi:hypothetical protein
MSKYLHLSCVWPLLGLLVLGAPVQAARLSAEVVNGHGHGQSLAYAVLTLLGPAGPASGLT